MKKAFFDVKFKENFILASKYLRLSDWHHQNVYDLRFAGKNKEMLIFSIIQ